MGKRYKSGDTICKKFTELLEMKYPKIKVNKESRKDLEKKLTDVFSLFIRARDNYTCFTCGIKKSDGAVIQCGHLLSCVSHSTKWDELNCHAQCQPCNWYHEEHPERYTYMWLKKHGQQQYELLYAKWNKTTKFTNADIKYLIKYYQDKLKEVR